MSIIKKMLKKILNYIIPEYSESGLFLSVTAMILLAIINPDLQKYILHLLWNGKGLSVMVLPIIGVVVCAIYAIIKQGKNSKSLQFYVMMSTIFIDLFTAVMFFGYLLFGQIQATFGLNIILPIGNVLHIFLIGYLIQNRMVTYRNVSEKNVTLTEIITGFILVSFIVLIAQYHYHLHWLYTYSLVIFYVSYINQGIRKILFNKSSLNLTAH